MKHYIYMFGMLLFSGFIYAQDSTSGFREIIREHTDDVECLAFSPDGKFLATGGWDKAIRVFSIDSNFTWMGTLYGHDAAVTTISFSRDSKKIISGGNDFNTIIWELAPEGIFVKKQSFKFNTIAVASVVYGLSLKTIFSASVDGKIYSYDLEKKVERKIDHKAPLNAIAVSNDQRMIFCADQTNILKQYDTKGTVIRSFDGHMDAINAVATALNNKFLVTGSSDKTAIIWDMQTGKQLRKLVGHDWKITSIAISVDSKYIVTGSTDGTTRLWEAETGKLLKTFSGVGNTVTYVALHPNNRLIASANHLESTLEEGYGPVIWNTGIEPVVKTNPRPAVPPKGVPVKTVNSPKKPAPKQTPGETIKKNDEVEISIQENPK